MHRIKARALLAAFVLSAVAAPSLAASWGVTDPRILGMGGAGVASGDISNAALINPALLAAPGARDRFALSLPIGVRLADPDELFDAVDDFADAEPIDAFTRALDLYRDDISNDANANAAIDAGNRLRAHLRTLNGKRLRAEAGAALVLGSPGERLGVSLYVDGQATGTARSRVTDADLDAIGDAIQTIVDGNPAIDPSNSLTSSIDARFATTVEAGVALATRLEALGGIALGVTPKYVQVRTYDYEFVGSELDEADIELENGERKESDFNLDVGVVKAWDNGWAVGLALRNLVKQEYVTVRGNRVEIEPQARLGIAHRGDMLTVALDVDLTENASVGLGNDKTRYAMLGVELDVLRSLRLRAGYRHNLADVAPGEEEGVASVGVGLRLLGVTLDAAVAGNSDDIGGALRLGVSF